MGTIIVIDLTYPALRERPLIILRGLCQGLTAPPASGSNQVRRAIKYTKAKNDRKTAHKEEAPLRLGGRE